MSNSLMDRMKLMLSKGIASDVHFLVGHGDQKELMKAHKCILMTVSDVFEAMFRFDAKANSPSVGKDGVPVPVTDIEPNVFKAMLSFIYTDDLAGLNGDNAMALLYAAKKYNISLLAKACLNLPIIELQNVFLAFDQSRLLDETEFARRCLVYIDRNAQTLLKSDAFLHIDQNLLYEILERDQLAISSESEIWNAAIRWADAQCCHIGTECSAENRRDVLGPALFQIRFPLIPQKDFSSIIVPLGVLTNEEIIGVFQHHCNPSSNFDKKYLLPFPTDGRISIRNRGKLMLDIEEFYDFTREFAGSSRYSTATVVGQLPWKIWAMINTSTGQEKCLAFYLICTAPKTDPSWSCTVNGTLRVISQKKGVQDKTETFDYVFHNNSAFFGFSTFINFSQLMDPNKGLYNRDKDKVKLAIDFDIKSAKYS